MIVLGFVDPAVQRTTAITGGFKDPRRVTPEGRRLVRSLKRTPVDIELPQPASRGRSYWPWGAGVGGAVAAFFVLRRVL